MSVYGWHVPKIGLRVNVEMFFDRQSVQDAMSKGEYRALMKSSVKVKDYARRSIKKVGAAKPPLKFVGKFPGLTLADIARLPGMKGKAADVNAAGSITESQRRQALERIREIRVRPPSTPGTPPNTHTPYSGHQASYLGFRRNLWNFYDAQTHSAVVGPSKKGRALPYLHEFGGSNQMRTWVWIPKWDNMKRPIVRKLPVGQRPSSPNWMPTSHVEGDHYPKRPYMGPALRKAIANGTIAKAFKNCLGGWRATSDSAGTFISRR